MKQMKHMRTTIIALLLLASGWARAQQNVSGYEYWFDRADASRIPVTLTDQNMVIDVSEAIPTAALPNGPHRINYRLRDSEGRWSGVLTRYFTKHTGSSNQVEGGEYWFDRNDEVPQPLTFTPGTDVDLSQSIPMGDLEPGPHTIRYRLRDSDGAWSGVLSKPFTAWPEAPCQLVGFRYWTDPAQTDPADMHYMPIDPSLQYLDVNTAIAFCLPTMTGPHAVYFQLLDNRGQWSGVITPGSGNVNVNQLSTGPDAPAISGPLDGIDPNTEYTFTASSLGATTFDWTLPNGWTIVSQTATSITATSPSMPQSETVFATASNDCGTSAQSSFPLSPTGVSETGAATSGYFIQPNPTSGLFMLSVPGIGASRIQVYSATGAVVLDQKPAQSDRLSLDLSNEASGLYTIRVFQGNEHTDLRVMVQH